MGVTVRNGPCARPPVMPGLTRADRKGWTMIITHYSGEGYGFMQGVQEYIEMYETLEDFLDGETEEQAIENHCAGGFKLERIYDTDIDTDFGSLPLNRSLIARM